MAALRNSLQALRQGVLAAVRLPANPSFAQQAAPALARGFAAEGSYLDKQQVQDRVLQVVKAFEKVEEGKVRTGEGPGAQGWPRRQGGWPPVAPPPPPPPLAAGGRRQAAAASAGAAAAPVPCTAGVLAEQQP